MRSIQRTDRALVGPASMICLADFIVAISFGALTVAAGLPWWFPVALSLATFAGAAQFVLVGVVSAGGGIVAAVLAALVVNLRLLPFSVAMSDVIGQGSLVRRLVGAHLLTDEATAFSMSSSLEDTTLRARAYWTLSAMLYVAWNLGVLGGALAGGLVGDPARLGLDVAYPAVLLALVLPTVREDRAGLAIAVVGSVLALVATPLLPPGLGVLAALVALLLVDRPRRRRGDRR